jgi:hypothetical protein
VPDAPRRKDQTDPMLPPPRRPRRGPRAATAAVRPRRLPTLLLLAVLAAGGPVAPPLARPAAGAPLAQPAPTDQADCEVPDTAPAPRPAVTIGVASPVAGRATPVAAEATPDADAVLAAELTAVARALAACLSEGEAETVAALATENYLGQLYGGGEPLPRDDYLALAPDLDPVPTIVRSLRDAERDGDEATAEVLSVVGRQLLRSRWTFVQAPAAERRRGRVAWRVEAEQPLPFDPPADASPLDVAIEEYAFGLTETTVDGPTVTIAGRNGGAEDHEILVLRFTGDATVADLLRQPGPGLPRGVAYVGQATVPAGDRAELVLVDLAPGDYTIVCLFPTPRGTPHLALGMEATFTVG